MASATEIKQFQLPNDTTKYDLIAKNGIFYIEGTGTTAGTWLGSHADITAYYEGLTVAYKIPVAGASTTKLNINSLGAVTVVKNATTAISTSYPVNSVALLVYTLDGTTAYWKTAEYGSTGDITAVTTAATSGLTGGKSSGSVALSVKAGKGLFLDENGVNVGQGSGIIVNDDDVAVNTSYTTSGKNYKVNVDSTTGGLYVNVPWTDTNTNTTYTLSTGDSNGQIKVTPSSGDPYNVSVKGLGSNAYTSTSYLPTAGGNISGHIYLTGAKEASSTGNTSQIVFGTSSNNHVAISSNNNALVINPTTSTTTSQIVLYLDKESQFPGGLRWSDVKNKTNASTTAAGLMSAADKTKLNNITAITNAQIDAICNASISNLSEVNF